MFPGINESDLSNSRGNMTAKKLNVTGNRGGVDASVLIAKSNHAEKQAGVAGDEMFE